MTCIMGSHIKRGFVRGLAVGGVEGSDRYGELVLEDVRGIACIFNIRASRMHTFKIVASTSTRYLRTCTHCSATNQCHTRATENIGLSDDCPTTSLRKCLCFE